MLVRMLHDHLRSSKGVAVEMGTPVDSIFLQDSSSDPSSSDSKHSKIVSMEYLTEQLCNGVDSKDFSKLSSSVATTIEYKKPAVTMISTSPYMAYNVSHSCKECTSVPTPSTTPRLPGSLISKLPMKDGSFIALKWHIPSSQAKHWLVGGEGKMYLKLSHTASERNGAVRIRTPVFVPTMGRDMTGLFNLFHTGYEQLQVLVTVETQFEKYCKAWPNHIIMAIPNQDAIGLGT